MHNENKMSNVSGKERSSWERYVLLLGYGLTIKSQYCDLVEKMLPWLKHDMKQQKQSEERIMVVVSQEPRMVFLSPRKCFKGNGLQTDFCSKVRKPW
jgi:hypothetical protein